ncbi:MAG: helix-turn-helix domain-containing protein [Salinivirgaceae bacterium]
MKKGLTQEELAEKTELSARTIQRIENGEVDPRAYSLQMIAKALDVDFSLFVENESKVDKEKKTEDTIILGLVHLSGLFLILIPTILIWSYKKNEVENITEHFKVVISFQILMWLVFLVGFIQYYTLNMPYMFYAGAIFTVFFSIMNAINVINNKPYSYFFLNKIKKKIELKEILLSSLILPLLAICNSEKMFLVFSWLTNLPM